MLDRMSLSVKNQWIDEENRVYIIFTLKNVEVAKEDEGGYQYRSAGIVDKWNS